MKLFSSFIMIILVIIALASVSYAFDSEAFIQKWDLRNDRPIDESTISNEDWKNLVPDIIQSHKDPRFYTTQGELNAPTLAQMQLSARLSAAAYCLGYSAQNLVDWKCAMCKKSGISVKEGTAWQFAGYELGAYVVYDATNNVIRLVYRGSSNFENWLANLNFAKSPFGNVSGADVHLGFKTAYLQSRPTVIAKLQALQAAHPNAPIQVTGHSLGGAIALIAALDLQNGSLATTTFNNGLVHVSSALFPEPLPFEQSELLQLGATVTAPTFKLIGPLFTFGQPRVGNQAFATWAASKLASIGYIRVTHLYDPVPRIPIQSMGFIHAPQEIYFTGIDSSTTYKVCATGPVEDKTCIIGPIINLSINDHMWYAGEDLHTSPAVC